MSDADTRPLLFDSHTFIWAMTQPERLPAATRMIASDPGRVILLSTASIWEIASKVGRGRWPEAAAPLHDLDATLVRAGITVLPVSSQHARAAGLLEWAHRDPFDRMLAAQAQIEGAILVTADRAYAGLPLAVMWN